jgi:hypothetical protein
MNGTHLHVIDDDEYKRLIAADNFMKGSQLREQKSDEAMRKELALVVLLDQDQWDAVIGGEAQQGATPPAQSAADFSQSQFAQDMEYAAKLAEFDAGVVDFTYKGTNPAAVKHIATAARFREYAKADCQSLALAKEYWGLKGSDPTDLQLQLAEAKASLHVPGSWICRKCGFQQFKNYLYVKSGTIGPDMSRAEPCPNDGEPMFQLTWKEHAEGMVKIANQQLQRALAAEKHLSPKPCPGTE